MKEKRTEQIAIRITPETKKELERIAERQKWTVAQTANLILEQFIRDRQEVRL